MHPKSSKVALILLNLFWLTPQKDFFMLTTFRDYASKKQQSGAHLINTLAAQAAKVITFKRHFQCFCEAKALKVAFKKNVSPPKAAQYFYDNAFIISLTKLLRSLAFLYRKRQTTTLTAQI